MNDTPSWPAYRMGPPDSIFALGVIGVNYARLEFAVHAMFATILSIPGILSYRLVYKIGPEIRDKLMREMLTERNWPTDVLELTQQFIEGQKVCYENRNKLMHSNIMSGPAPQIVLYKTGRDGRTTLSSPTLQELRQVADDMKTYCDYGLCLSNMIQFDLLGAKRAPGHLFFPTWPEKPPLPIPLEYTSDPFPIEALE